MTWLISADLHLTDRPRDSYRFGLFKWLAIQQQKYNVTATFILGDITDRKDSHPSALVNRTVDELLGLKPPIFILKGNHDYISPTNPFFRFLSYVEGIEFISEPTVLREFGVAMLPHQPDQASFDRACEIIPHKAAGVMVHELFTGAIAETGSHLSGLSASAIDFYKPLGVWAGDVHRPQTVNCGAMVTYVGSPYPVRFADDFTPRVLLVKNGVEQNLYYPSLRKWMLKVRDADEILNNEDLFKGDHVKLTVTLAREEVVEWAAHKQRVLDACKELGLEVFGIDLEVSSASKRERPRVGAPQAKTHQEVFYLFCQSEGVASSIKQAGKEILQL